MGEGKWERKKKSDGKKEKWREVALRREDYALLQTNGRQLRAICHIYTYIYIYRRRGLPLDNSTAVPRFRGCFRGLGSSPPGAIHRSPGNCQRSAPRTQV